MASYSKRYKKDPETGEILIDPKTKKEIIIGWRIAEIINGQRKEFTDKTKKDAQAKRDAYVNELNNYGNIIKDTSITVAELVYDFLFSVKINQVSNLTFQLLNNIYNKHIKDSKFGSLKINEVTQSLVQKYLNQLSTKHSYSYSYIRQHYLLLLGAYNNALENDLIRKNPVKGVTLPQQNKKVRKVDDCFTLEEQKAYIRALEEEPYKLVMLIALFAGLRQSEVTSLKWNCVNTEEKYIKVSAVTQNVKVYSNDGTFEKQQITKAPKSAASFRTVPIPNFLNDLLIQYKPDVDNIEKQLVFKSSTGSQLSAKIVLSRHKKACERAKIRPVEVDGKTQYKGITFHGLRHTYITRLIEAGENIKKVQQLAGHSNAETTLKIYTHVMRDSVRSAAEKQDLLYDSFK